MRHLLTCLFLLIAMIGWADSPLTSTFFASAYADEPLIAELIELRENQKQFRHTLRSEHFTFFDDGAIGLDVKVALVNALGWDQNENLDHYLNHLAKKYQVSRTLFENLVNRSGAVIVPARPTELEMVHYHDFCLLAYIQGMHDYFKPENAFIPANYARLMAPESETATWVFALLYAQFFLDFSWCDVYRTCESVILLGPTFHMDSMRFSAINLIMDYIGPYVKSCETESLTDADMPEIEDWDPMTPFPMLTQAYFDANPVFTRPARRQESTRSKSVNLKLQNSENPPYLYSWIEYDNETDGTAIEVYIRNTGNTTSIETNLAIIIEADIDMGIPEMHVQAAIPPIAGNSQTMIVVKLGGYWIYDPNAAFRIILDYDDVILESDEKDNEKRFFEWG